MDDNPALEFNLPWIKPITELINSFNLNCTHQGFCHPACFKRQNRAAKRLTRALREMYGEKVEYIEEMSLLKGFYKVSHVHALPQPSRASQLQY